MLRIGIITEIGEEAIHNGNMEKPLLEKLTLILKKIPITK